MKPLGLDPVGTKRVVVTTDVVTAPIAQVVTETAQQETAKELGAQQKERVGLDGEKRAQTRSTAPKGSVARMLARQVQRSRDRDVMKQLTTLAGTLDVESAGKTAKFLGAGTFGATFDLGTGFVLKHFGDEQCTMGALAAAMPPDTFTAMAKRQVAVHMALKDAGFPCVPAVIVAGHPTWVLMQKAPGLALSELTDAEKQRAHALCEQIRSDIGPTVNDALKTLGIDVSTPIDTDVHAENARFTRTPNGVAVAGFFDPIV